ncbi:hypothetical protein [Halioxenophilus sp. WMMB6]|uniref:hypothetical protein n=1 Tax=Halioxenophilus sp. WMMB6 TaxID=3073815 RepID=UPI00295F22F2|nr:hypothetical protein [Halioxenophilus sp. WMMB6]
MYRLSALFGLLILLSGCGFQSAIQPAVNQPSVNQPIGETLPDIECLAALTEPERALVDIRCVASSIEFEQSLNGREGLPLPADTRWFQVVEGPLPVVISAPHATRPLREGKRRFADGAGTAALAKAVAALTGATVIYTTYEGPSDPNYYDANEYKQALAELIAKQQPTLLLDIHGSHPYRAYDIDIGTLHGQSLLGDAALLEQLISALKGEGINAISQNYFAAEKRETVTKFAAGLGVPALQLEVNANWVTPARGDMNAQRYALLVQALARYILAVQASDQ